MRSRSNAYIVLQENLSADEEMALQQAVADALPLIPPSHAFVEDLGRDLVA